jgi:catechol 2,3-dioxygenase-like lactoylglutathione lyase family enzyme
LLPIEGGIDMMDLKIGTINHFHLNVSDLGASSQFYQKFFGFQPYLTVVGKRPILFLRNVAGFSLGLEDNNPDKRPLPDWHHLGVRLDDPDRVRAAREFMDNEGVTLEGDLFESDEYVSFVCLDPDGYHIEVFYDAAFLACEVELHEVPVTELP